MTIEDIFCKLGWHRHCKVIGYGHTIWVERCNNCGLIIERDIRWY